MMDSISKICATFFCIGYLPVAPGSIATVIGILISFALMGNPVMYAAVALMITVIGFAISGRAERVMGKKDPGCIVIDEVAGVMIACFLLPVSLPVLWTVFFLFRAFDMFKIYPGNKFEGLSGSSGIMMDDIVAGLYTNVVMHLALRWSGI
jgi:phosphatidylglycerophosphatase A